MNIKKEKTTNKIWVDAGTHKNRICLVDGSKTITREKGLDYTNNELEYYAVLYGLRYINNNYPRKKITLYSDSLLIVNQMNGRWRVTTPNLIQLHIKCHKLHKSNVTIKWIKRDLNKAGWVLEKLLRSKS